MSEPEPFRIFVSYSRVDLDLVAPVVQLLRATRGLVFQDWDSLRAGQPWRPQIEQAIDVAHLVAVFWCAHSGASQEVRKEYERAIGGRKDVMPVILDSTPLPGALGAFHGIDFREVVGRDHGSPRVHPRSAESIKSAPPRRSWAGFLWTGAVLVVVALAVLTLLYMYSRGNRSTLALLALIVGAFALLALIVGVLWRRLRQPRREPASDRLQAPRRDNGVLYDSRLDPMMLVQHGMAAILRPELLNRAERLRPPPA